MKTYAKLVALILLLFTMYGCGEESNKWGSIDTLAKRQFAAYSSSVDAKDVQIKSFERKNSQTTKASDDTSNLYFASYDIRLKSDGKKVRVAMYFSTIETFSIIDNKVTFKPIEPFTYVITIGIEGSELYSSMDDAIKEVNEMVDTQFKKDLMNKIVTGI